jgi:hypothetical protein
MSKRTTFCFIFQSPSDVVSPDVFISYQWGKQKEISALFQRLTSLGLTCWMDVHQMGGGDSLYDKIDRGVRGCKVVLSSVTTKYALSANCRREVSLADALKKPIIPMLMEKIDWPPSGPMSMVLTQLLYVNFSKDESTQLSWEGKTFDELLHKVKQHIPLVEDGAIQDEKPKKVDTPSNIHQTAISSKTADTQTNDDNTTTDVTKTTTDAKTNSDTKTAADTKANGDTKIHEQADEKSTDQKGKLDSHSTDQKENQPSQYTDQKENQSSQSTDQKENQSSQSTDQKENMESHSVDQKKNLESQSEQAQTYSTSLENIEHRNKAPTSPSVNNKKSSTCCIL